MEHSNLSWAFSCNDCPKYFIPLHLRHDKHYLTTCS